MPSTKTTAFNLERELTDIQGFCREILNEGGQVYPTWTAWSRDEDLPMMITTPWADDDEKNRMASMVEGAFVIHNVNRYIMFSEVWTAKAKEGRQPAPSQNPERQEALAILHVHEKASESYIYPIIRCHDGAVIFEEKKICHETKGRMVELLPPPDAPVFPKWARARMMELLQKDFGIKGEKL